MRFPSYASALAWLYARNQFAIKLGLERMRALLDALGNPERDLAFLHVAGTNGKGSVCAALAAMLPSLGVRRVGLYTSPHLVSFRERIRVDGEPVPAAWVTDWLNTHIALLEERNPTYFEIVTVMALCAFRERGCGAVVLETGLGGRLDATNVVTPRVAVITAIDFDHMAHLGNTLEAIQSEKLGIAKAGAPLVVDEARTGLAARAEAAAREAEAPFLNLADRLDPRPGGYLLRGRFADYEIPGDLREEGYPLRNAALAALALEAYHGKALPADPAWLPALRDARMPGRLQRLAAPGYMDVLLDAAHNPAGMEALAAHLRQEAVKASRPIRRRVFFSAMRDKNVAAVAEALAAFADEPVFVDLSAENPRALPGGELRELLPQGAFPGLKLLFPDAESLQPLLRAGSGADEAVFCGSIFLLGAVIPVLAEHYAGLEEFAKLRREDDTGGGPA